ncbi:cysteine--tRNA ligase [Myxococcota bacterium]|nr:cysteine--tRNA ligase [Myxococcota bacterium]MBU1383196.1 cysteine--tRNA ligase [Myxococcota bacterium]MBU1496430.1 cysteine--tRNA ligase [Myxococcota bacterium]
MPVIINDVLSGKKVEFLPRDPGKAGIYVCGVTVYDRCHIGHLRSSLSFDAIVRHLEYRGYKVTYVRNFTDIDDKILGRSAEIEEGPTGSWRKSERYNTFTDSDWVLRDSDDENIRKINAQSGRPLALDVSDYFITQFHNDYSPFDMREPDEEPRVSENMNDIIDLIEKIIDNGFGYESGGDVYFDVEAYHSKTGNYGVLSRRDYSQLREGARVTPGDLKRNGVDFALWKAAKTGEVSWDSPWGKGRPGWHIECSAMSCHFLGQTFDIHGGGKDLIFPHHENEIAQSEAGYGHKFSKYWLHNGFVTVDGVKMSKSLGNFLSLDDANRLAMPEVWRYLILSVHYSSPIDFSMTKTNENGDVLRGSVDVAAERVHYFYQTIERANEILKDVEIIPDVPLVKPDIAGKLVSKFNEAMDDDFNTAIAISYLGETAKSINELVSLRPKEVRKIGEESYYLTLSILLNELTTCSKVLGLFTQDPSEFLNKMRHFELNKRGMTVAEIEEVMTKRKAAKDERNFELADSLRDSLLEKGIFFKDMPGYITWDVRF